MLSREFFTAGRAVFTVSNPRNEHYTYRISPPDTSLSPAKKEPPLFISVLTEGSKRKFRYLGVVNRETGEVRLTNGSTFTTASLAFKVAKWALQQAWKGTPLPEGYRIQHEGQCAKCGKALTDPQSIECGLGPKCSGRSK